MTSPYDVLIHIPSLFGGGAERVAIEISRYLKAKKYRIALFVHHRDLHYELLLGIDVVVATRNSHIGRVWEFRRFLKQTGTPVVISFLPYANLISALARLGLRSVRRLVVSEHLSYSVLKPRELKQRFKLALALLMYQQSDAIVAVSKGVADELKSRLNRKSADKVTVIYNPCFIEGAEYDCHSANAQGANILAVGRLVHQKGFDTLIRAFWQVKAELGDATLRIIGEGPDRPKLESLVDELGLGDSVSLPGFTRDIRSEYARSNVFVCASRAEGFGNVIVEAMSYGMTVVSTDCPFGPEEILEAGRFGALVPVDDAQSLATEIVRQYRSPADPLVQIQRARAFSLDAIGAQYVTVSNL